MSATSSMLGRRLAASVFGLAIGFASLLSLSGCAGEKLKGDASGIQTKLQRAIRDGSKTIGCAPKETALAEANIKFAEDALAMGEFYRGKEHVELADIYTKLAVAKTDPVRCRDPGAVAPTPGDIATDKDQDGYDDDVDQCPENPEDFDQFEDEDGCPDEDNDKDGVLDASEFVDGRWTNLDKKGETDCRNDPEDMDGFEDEDGCPDPDNDQDGILDGNDTCPNEPEDFDQFEDEDGCPDPDNDQDKILDVDDQCPLDPEDYDGDKDEDGCPDLAAKWDGCQLKLDDKVYFASNKAEIQSKSFELLNDVAKALTEGGNKAVTIEIGGHTDSKGSNKYNKKLSQRRVESVRTYLINAGIPASRMTAVGYGEEMPIDTNRTAAGRANNRRVEFNRTDNECKK